MMNIMTRITKTKKQPTHCRGIRFWMNVCLIGWRVEWIPWKVEGELSDAATKCHIQLAHHELASIFIHLFTIESLISKIK